MSTIAQDNFERHLRRNPYPGRGLVIGRAESGAWAADLLDHGAQREQPQPALCGRGEILRTEPIDAAQVDNPELIIYEAMLTLPGTYLVSNGDQTRTLADNAGGGRDV